MNGLNILFSSMAALALTSNALYLQPYNLASFSPLAIPHTRNFGYYPYFNAMLPSYGFGYSLATETDHNRLRSEAASSQSLQVCDQLSSLISLWLYIQIQRGH